MRIKGAAGVWALAIALLLAACATDREQTPALATVMAALQLPPPAALGRSVDAVQLLTARHGDQSFTLEMRLSINSERLLLVGTDLMGRRVMTLRWDGQNISFDHPEGLPEVIRPEAMLADVVLLYWPLEVVREIVGTDGDVEDTPGGRTVRRGGRAVMVASYEGPLWNGIIRYRNPVWDYTIEIESREQGR